MSALKKQVEVIAWAQSWFIRFAMNAGFRGQVLEVAGKRL